MKQLAFTIIFVFSSTSIGNSIFCQTTTTESKSCGSCGKKVSNNSKIGMTCPHCGVRWGYENEHKSTNYNYNYNFPTYSTSTSIGYTNANSNLRTFPSKSAPILTVVPKNTMVTVKEMVGDWYKVEYSYYENYQTKKISGYIHQTLIN